MHKTTNLGPVLKLEIWVEFDKMSHFLEVNIYLLPQNAVHGFFG